MIIDAMGLIPTTFVIAFYSLPLFLVPIFILHHFLVFVVLTGKYKEKETFSKLVPFDCDLHQCFSFSLSFPPVKIGWQSGVELGISLFPCGSLEWARDRCRFFL